MDLDFANWEPRLRSLLRVVAGFTFSLHGFQKLFGMFGGMGKQGGSADLFSLMGMAGVLETFAGVLIMVGLLTRPAAFLLSGQMAVAYFMVHAPKGFWPIQNGGELAALYSFLFLWFVGAGAGQWSLDQALEKKEAVKAAAAS